ncbi:Alpha-tectorin [Liparis tanakae]|uniref:Alpha-tectorin n=1 Tax=Liparis tanakae TaxID=230148 RepID=A0A4Z2ITK8_9TELE|nr:Alpha-tectorin [Liparis tanakae]
MKTAVLIFVLAVAASQVDLVLSQNFRMIQNGDTALLRECPIFFLGKEYVEVKVAILPGGPLSFCFSNTDHDYDECVLLKDHGASTVLKAQADIFVNGPLFDFYSSLPSITEIAECSYNYLSGSMVNFYLNRVGPQTVLVVETLAEYTSDTVDVETTIDGDTVDSWSFEADGAPIYIDLSGCRSQGAHAPPTIDPLTCVATCTSIDKDEKEADIVTECTSPEICNGNNECIVPTPVCTVAGSTVIDFFNTVHSVPDLCAYTVLGNSEIEISVVFNVLEEILDLTSTAQTLHGVDVYQDDKGITLKTPLTQTIIHFDGDTAHVTAGEDEEYVGVCGNPAIEVESQTTLADSVNFAYNPSGCAASLSTDLAITADCSASDDYCDLMSQAPFTDCPYDPEPFITACKSIACKYTEDDRPAEYPACLYMQAYAKACFLKAGKTLEDWRSTAGCSQPTICTQSSIAVTLVECLLWEHGVDPSTLNLKDETCKGESDPDTGMMIFNVGVDDCGTEVTKDDGNLVYENAIMKGSKPLSDITREKTVEIDFSCSVKAPELQSVTFRIQDGSMVQTIEDEELSYTLAMTVYTDANFKVMVDQDTDVKLNQKVWVEIKTEDLDENTVAVVTDSCWVTADVDPSSSPSHDLVIGGCPNPDDLTVEMDGNGLGLSNSFCFRMFQYTDLGNSEMYLHCAVKLCSESTPPPTCGGASRKRRSARPGYAGMARPPVGLE